jgi:nicotinamide mononucleotide adenylyltransferase
MIGLGEIVEGSKPYVWLGRYQPIHNGHIEILMRSLSVFTASHLVGITWTENDPLRNRPDAKFRESHNPFTVWERAVLAEFAISEIDAADRVRVITVPRADPHGERDSEFLPPHYVRCTTDKDDEDLAKSARWKSRNLDVAILNVADMAPMTSTSMRTAIRDGAPWQTFMPPATHEFFKEIDGPRRFSLAD